MKADVILGLQWGDEGKGKVVDVLAGNYPVVARFQGGPNAGHSIHFGDKSFVLRSIPSGIFREDALNIIGNGVVLDPITFRQECEALIGQGIPVKERIYISRKAHLILPTHRILDAASEAAKGKSKIGSTLKGIGPAYMDKTGRNGMRVGDLEAGEADSSLIVVLGQAVDRLADHDEVVQLAERGVVGAGAGHVHNAFLSGHETAGSQHAHAFQYQRLALADGFHGADETGKDLAGAFQLAARLDGVLDGHDTHAIAGMGDVQFHIGKMGIFQQQGAQLFRIDGKAASLKAGGRPETKLRDVYLVQFKLHDWPPCTAPCRAFYGVVTSSAAGWMS